MTNPGGFLRPEVTDLGRSSVGALRADQQQQQQQQQSYSSDRHVRRFLDPDTALPQEEVVEKLTTEIRQVNKLTPNR